MSTATTAWLRMLLASRTRALTRVVRERDELREVVTKAAPLERAGWEVYKLHAQGDEPVRPSAIIITAEGDVTHAHH